MSDLPGDPELPPGCTHRAIDPDRGYACGACGDSMLACEWDDCDSLCGECLERAEEIEADSKFETETETKTKPMINGNGVTMDEFQEAWLKLSEQDGAERVELAIIQHKGQDRLSRTYFLASIMPRLREGVVQCGDTPMDAVNPVVAALRESITERQRRIATLRRELAELEAQ